MENNSSFWLDIKTEYIDDNFENLVLYLKEGNRKNDTFYNKTIELLMKRGLQLIKEIATRPIPQDEGLIEKRPFNIRLLAAFMLSDKDGLYVQKAFVAMLSELHMLVPKLSSKYLETVMEIVYHEKITNLGFTWDDIVDFNAEKFACKIIPNRPDSTLITNVCWCNEYGGVYLSNHSLWLLPTLEKKVLMDPQETALNLDSGIDIKVSLYGQMGLKQDQLKDILAIYDFTKGFIDEMQDNRDNNSHIKILSSYKEGEKVIVRVSSIKKGKIRVVTTDPNFNQIEGTIVFESNSLLNYEPRIFAKYMKVGDLFPAYIKSTDTKTFSIDKTFPEFIVNDYKEYYVGEAQLALLIDSTQAEYVWLNCNGVPIYTHPKQDYHKGDFANVKATIWGTKKALGIIKGKICSSSDGNFNEEEARIKIIRSFVSLTPKTTVNKKTEPDVDLDQDLLRLLIRLLFAYHKYLLKPVERAKILAVTRILAEILYDKAAAEYIEFTSDFLRALVLFARSENVKKILLKIPEGCKDNDAVIKRLVIVELLKQWGATGYDESLSNIMKEYADTMPKVAHIAQIVRATNSMMEIIKGQPLNVLKREVIKDIRNEIEDDIDLENEIGIYFGVESELVEFKESVVFPPDNNGKMNVKKQRHNVLRGICAFLNSLTGGTLYLGVSDLGYLKGIQRDLDALNITSPDAYMRQYIQDPAKELLGLDAIACMHFELCYDNQVVAIHIDPFPYRIIELEGKAYERINAESIEMKDTSKQQLLHKKVFQDKDKVANLSLLEQALQLRKQVILHNYSSSNGKTVSDRIVEAYDVDIKSNLVICFDHKDNKCKSFNLNRIDYVEITDKTWDCQKLHIPLKADAFRMTGEANINCCLELDLFAKNLLVEEFPNAESDLKKANDNMWTLNTKVHHVAGIGRFVAGLANHIRIINAPELKEYLKNYFKDYLGNINDV